jgi:hypothetical protein
VWRTHVEAASMRDNDAQPPTQTDQYPFVVTVSADNRMFTVGEFPKKVKKFSGVNI